MSPNLNSVFWEARTVFSCSNVIDPVANGSYDTLFANRQEWKSVNKLKSTSASLGNMNGYHAFGPIRSARHYPMPWQAGCKFLGITILWIGKSQ